MTDTSKNADAEAATGDKLSSLRVAELQQIAQQLSIKGSARMRKSTLIEAIEEARAGGPSTAPAKEAPKTDETTPPAKQQPAAQDEPEISIDLEAALDEVAAAKQSKTEPAPVRERENGRGRQQQRGGENARKQDASGDETPKTLDEIVLPAARDEQGEDDDSRSDNRQGDQQSNRKRNRNRNRGKGNQPGDDSNKSSEETQPQQPRQQQQQQQQQSNRAEDQKQTGRQRDRKRSHRDDADPEIAPDDVLLPIAGILDVLDNYAFVRTSGYLAGVNDVYVSLGQVKKYGLRKGDAIVGAIRQPREGEYQGGRQKYNALVRIDTINGDAPDTKRERPQFDDLTPLYPEERITLETESGHAAQRMIDLFAPIGKGTRGLIVAPPKSGKSIMLERIANAIAQNSPDTHLMLVLVDERPEEVTRLQRTIHGEVVASTFDMPAENHTTIAELAIERAKRLVELGLDVVVLLDSITQLCRAYNLTAPASGRVIAGGVDASALYPPKRFFGAARKVENGGSLTILATAMAETGSRTDEVILEEFLGTGNMELRLSREIADKRIFPALDIQQSSTLHEEQLLTPNELEVTWSIRRALDGNTQAALEPVLERISSTSTNEDFLSSVRANPINPAVAK